MQKDSLLLGRYLGGVKGDCWLPEEILECVPSRKLIIKLVERNILTQNNCPASWRSDAGLVAIAPNYVRMGYARKDIVAAIARNEAMIENVFVSNGKDVYRHLLPYCGDNKFAALEFLRESRNDMEIAPLVPKKLWASKGFCLEALSISRKSAKYVPKEFFSEKNFVFDLFVRVDQLEIGFDVLMEIPEINKFVTSFDLRAGTCLRFLEKYVSLLSLADLGKKEKTGSKLKV